VTPEGDVICMRRKSMPTIRVIIEIRLMAKGHDRERKKGI
jgi:hypothetical protein